ncbi:hypothetical protein CHU98_g8677 [Xylaria longipes]|nr:hypothetical protein CHU98_g8677 [Xylaria longipes]
MRPWQAAISTSIVSRALPPKFIELQFRIASKKATSSSEKDAPVVRPIRDYLFEVTISRKNRVSLLSNAVQRLDNNSEEAELIRRNLEAWPPPVASFFNRRTPELVYNVPFRLVFESDRGFVSLVDKRPVRQYLAVSYCWRPEGTSDEAWLGPGLPSHKPWPISRSFVDAILAQRGIHTEDKSVRDVHFQREGIWFDLMRIRQENPEEKIIARLDIIYTRCRKLLIVLEHVVLDHDEVQHFQRFGPYFPPINQDRKIWEPLQTEVPHIISLVYKIEESRWRSR